MPLLPLWGGFDAGLRQFLIWQFWYRSEAGLILLLMLLWVRLDAGLRQIWYCLTLRRVRFLSEVGSMSFWLWGGFDAALEADLMPRCGCGRGELINWSKCFCLNIVIVLRPLPMYVLKNLFFSLIWLFHPHHVHFTITYLPEEYGHVFGSIMRVVWSSST